MKLSDMTMRELLEEVRGRFQFDYDCGLEGGSPWVDGETEPAWYESAMRFIAELDKLAAQAQAYAVGADDVKERLTVGDGPFVCMCLECSYACSGFPNAGLADGMANLHRDAWHHEVLVLKRMDDLSNADADKGAPRRVAGAPDASITSEDMTT